MTKSLDAEQRWHGYAFPGASEHFAGETLSPVPKITLGNLCFVDLFVQ